jgi:hypothetical protein
MGWTRISASGSIKCRQNFNGEATENGYFEDTEGDGKVILELSF